MAPFLNVVSSHREVARQPAETPKSVFVRIKQTRYNMLITEL